MNLEQAFLEKMRQHDPERYKEVCKKYPVLTKRALGRIYEHELSGFGLIGLQQSRLPEADRESYGFYDEEDE